MKALNLQLRQLSLPARPLLWSLPLLAWMLTATYGCNNSGTKNGKDGKSENADLHHGTVKGNKVKGPYKHYSPPDKMVPNEDKAPLVPEGPKRGKMAPANKSIDLKKLRPHQGNPGGGGDPVVFGNYNNAFGTTVANL